MRKWLFFAFPALAAAVFFTGCPKEEEPKGVTVTIKNLPEAADIGLPEEGTPIFSVQLCEIVNHEQSIGVGGGNIYPRGGGSATTIPLRHDNYDGEIWEGTGKYHVKLKVNNTYTTEWKPDFKKGFKITNEPVEFNGDNVTLDYRNEMNGDLNPEDWKPE